MIRVTKTEEPSKTVVTIDGQLSGESVGLVETCCKEAESDGKPVYLYSCVMSMPSTMVAGCY